MRILMFSPAARSSAIARMASLVVRQLIVQGHEVSVVRTEAQASIDEGSHDFGVPLIAWSQRDEVVKCAKASDTVVYQVGDNFNFHQGCLEWLPSHPGVICLHDYFLGHLFWGWSDTVGRKKANGILAAWYGAEVASRFFQANSSTEFIEFTRIAAPMTEWVSSMATGIIAHSGWDMDRILASCGGPVEIVPLPYDKPSTQQANSRILAPSANAANRLSVLTIGHVNANKRAESVIRAIGGSFLLRRQLCYRIVGKIEPSMAAHLQEVARDSNVSIVITGEVDEETLASEITAADIVCCLRLPVLEAASASTIESMLMAKATLVVNDGFYRELPDSCVVKISPDREVDDIRDALTMLSVRPSLRIAMGRNAEAYAEKTFSAERYAKCLVDICVNVATAMPAMRAADIMATHLVNWGRLHDKDTLQQIIAPLQGFMDISTQPKSAC